MTDLERRLRSVHLGELLVREGVLDLLDNYDGPRDPVALAETASVVGIRGLEAADFEILLDALPTAGEHIGRLLGGGL